METEIDVLVIGGGAAGAAAALQLGRVRRTVTVVDSGEPRNAPAAHMHGYLAHDGIAPADFAEVARAELGAYGIDVVRGRVVSVVDSDDSLTCTTADGIVHRARRVVLATGLTDVLPDIDGVAELWGDRVIHCPWCHGWEVRDQRIAVIDTTGMGSHQALVFAQLSDHVTVIGNLSPGLADEEAERLQLAGVRVEPRAATRIIPHEDRLEVELGAAVVAVDVVAVAPQFEPNIAMVDGLVEVEGHPSGLGRHVVVDEFGATSHPRIFAVGNVTDPMHQVLHAAAHGSKAATWLNAGLIDDDIARAGRSATRQVAWDERYEERGAQMWSGKPNGTLVVETQRLTPGRALDVGCGEGADAIWLAQQGWNVTGTDISAVAVERAEAAATSLGVGVTFTAADTAVQPFEAGAFDLVTLAYPAFERNGGLAAVRAIAAAVAVDGRLLVVGHVCAAHGPEHATAHGFDPNDYVSIDDIIEVIDSDFDIETDDERERQDAPADARHSRDRVLVARRL